MMSLEPLVRVHYPDQSASSPMSLSRAERIMSMSLDEGEKCWLASAHVETCGVTPCFECDHRPASIPDLHAYRVIDYDSGVTLDTLRTWLAADRLAEYLRRFRRVNAYVETVMVPNY